MSSLFSASLCRWHGAKSSFFFLIPPPPKSYILSAHGYRNHHPQHRLLLPGVRIHFNLTSLEPPFPNLKYLIFTILRSWQIYVINCILCNSAQSRFKVNLRMRDPDSEDCKGNKLCLLGSFTDDRIPTTRNENTVLGMGTRGFCVLAHQTADHPQTHIRVTVRGQNTAELQY